MVFLLFIEPGDDVRVLVDAQVDGEGITGVNSSGEPSSFIPLPFSLHESRCLALLYGCKEHPKGHVDCIGATENPEQEFRVLILQGKQYSMCIPCTS